MRARRVAAILLLLAAAPSCRKEERTSGQAVGGAIVFRSKNGTVLTRDELEKATGTVNVESR